MTDLAYGIDFGTTNSSVGYHLGDRTVIVPSGMNGRPMMRSVLYFPEGERQILVGDEATERYLEDDLWGRFIQSPKTILSSESFKFTNIRGINYEAEDLIEPILAHLKARADRATGHNVRRVVIGRPVRFSDDARKDQLAEQRLWIAAEQAGFEEIKFQLEPIAAAMAYEVTMRVPEVVLVADLGGGTSDFTIMSLDPSKVGDPDRSRDVIATGGIPIAGDMLDSAIMRNKLSKFFGASVSYRSFLGNRLPIPASIIVDFCHKGRVIFLYNQGTRRAIEEIRRNTDDREPLDRMLRLIDENLGYPLFDAVERVKCQLSINERAEIDFNRSGLIVNASITRHEFRDMIDDPLNRIRRCLCDLLAGAEFPARRIDRVFLTGGTSLVPSVRALLGEIFGHTKLDSSLDTFTSVVKGLAISGQKLFRV